MEEKKITEGEEKKSLSFVEQFVKEDLEAGKNGGRIQTRFPPEPNGIYTSDTPRPSAWTSALQRSSAASVTCVSTIQTPPRRIRNTWRTS